MTEDQRTMALALVTAGMWPGSATKRFAQDMARLALQADPPPLSPKQHAFLCSSVVRFRRQLPARAVTLATAQLPPKESNG